MATATIRQFKDRIRGREVNADSTVDDYATWVERFRMWAGDMEPSDGLLRDFDTFLQDDGLPNYPWENARGRPAPASYAYQTRVKALSAVKLWARVIHGVEIETDVQNIAEGKPADFDPDYLPREEIDRTVETADVTCDVPGCDVAIRLGYDAIMRSSELVQVERDDVDLDAGTVYVNATKGSLNATLGLDDGTVRLLRRHVDQFPERNRLFYNSYDRPLRAQSWSNHFLRKHHEAGFHAFARHSPIVHTMEDEGFGAAFRRARHQHPTTTVRYARLIGVDIPAWASE